MNKYLLSIVLFLVFFTACGGGSSNENYSFDGTWHGSLKLISDCPIGPNTSDLVNREYEIKVRTQDDIDGNGFRDVFIRDNFGKTYSGDILPTNRFGVASDDIAFVTNDIDFNYEDTFPTVETGPDSIELSDPSGTTVKASFIYSRGIRFCSDEYQGEFTKREKPQ